MTGIKTSKTWHRLDNTANLFPVITSRRFPNVYRLSVTLVKPIVPDLLQQALEATLPLFAAFRVRMRRGLFWRYFETNPSIPFIEEENAFPCAFIDSKENNNYLFRVTYYETRINLEVFHALSDGTGGFQFLRALCCRYLLYANPGSFTSDEHSRPWFAEHASDTEDSYVSNYLPKPKSGFQIGHGFRLAGEHNPLDLPSITHAYIPVFQILALCREKGVSVTQYLAACICWSVYVEQMHCIPPHRPINLFLPINLRTLFPSTTTLNFFSNIYISLAFQDPAISFTDVLAEVKLQFSQKISKEALLQKISYTVGSGYSLIVRMIPLPIKTLALRAIFKKNARSSTLGFSNLGVLSMPSPFDSFVSGFSVLLGSSPREPFKAAAVSYKDTLCLSFTNTLRNPALQRSVVRKMASDGLMITVETNGVSL